MVPSSKCSSSQVCQTCPTGGGLVTIAALYWPQGCYNSVFCICCKLFVGTAAIPEHRVEPGHSLRLAQWRCGSDHLQWHPQPKDWAGHAAGLLVYHVHGPPQLPYCHPCRCLLAGEKRCHRACVKILSTPGLMLSERTAGQLLLAAIIGRVSYQPGQCRKSSAVMVPFC